MPVPTPIGKQFIATNDSHLGETVRRALFWYREELFGGLEKQGRIVAHWKCTGSSLTVPQRRGHFSLRHIRLNEAALTAVVVPKIYTTTLVTESTLVAANSWKCPLLKTVSVDWKIFNTRNTDVNLIWKTYPIYPAAALGGLIAFSGSTERLLTIKKNSAYVVSLAMVIMGTCRVLFPCHVQEIGVKHEETIIQASKYDVPTIVLCEIENSNWADTIEICA